jgi:hypothetical protein
MVETAQIAPEPDDGLACWHHLMCALKAGGLFKAYYAGEQHAHGASLAVDSIQCKLSKSPTL